jgi:Protein of unknown function (DUF3302)
MNSLLALEVGFWDYITFAVLFVCLVLFLVFLVWLAGLPGNIAIARKHPDAEAVKIMGYAGFLAVVPWIQAFIWAFKPTNIVDIRRSPREEAKAIDEQIARLKGQTGTPSPEATERKKSATKSDPAD